MMSARNRDVSFRKALRKRRIDRMISSSQYYDNLHEYSKGKIHCSCPSCNAKSKNKGKRRYKTGNYNYTYNWKPSDLRQLDNMDFQEQDEQI